MTKINHERLNKLESGSERAMKLRGRMRRHTQLPARIPTLRNLRAYIGNNRFLLDLQKQVLSGNLLTDKQILAAEKNFG